MLTCGYNSGKAAPPFACAGRISSAMNFELFEGGRAMISGGIYKHNIIIS